MNTPNQYPPVRLQGQVVKLGDAVQHVDGALGVIEKVYLDGTILVHWNDGSINRWDADEHRMLIPSPLHK